MKDFIKNNKKKIIKHSIIFLILLVCSIISFNTITNAKNNFFYCNNPECEYYEEELSTAEITTRARPNGTKVQYCSHCNYIAKHVKEDNDGGYSDEEVENMGNDWSGITESLIGKVFDWVIGRIIEVIASIIGLIVKFVGNIITKFIINDPAYLIDVGLNIESKVPVIGSFIIKLNQVVKTCCLSVIIILILKQTFMTYVLWQSGSPDENPFEIIFRMGLALAMIVCIADLYNILLSLFKNEYTKLIETINVSQEFSFDVSLLEDFFEFPESSAIWTGLKALVGNIAFIIILFTYVKYCFLALLHIIQNGLEMLIVRACFPIFCLEIIKPNNNFQNILMLTFKCVFNIILSSFLVGLSYMVMCNLGNFTLVNFLVVYFSALALVKMASGSNAILNQFFGSTVGQLGSSVGGGVAGDVAGRLVNKIPVVSKVNSWLKN